LTYLGFITEGKLADVLIKPSLGVSNWPVIYIINYTPAKHHKFSGTIAGDCKMLPHQYRAIKRARTMVCEIEPKYLTESLTDAS
jgi:hypothetical protein